jgi:ERCC4-type nuclease
MKSLRFHKTRLCRYSQENFDGVKISLRVIADYREKASGVIDLLACEGVEIEIAKVSYGDYVINDAITIERKTARDFLISVIDGRLFSQLSRLKRYCVHPVVLIEGNPFRTDLDFHESAIRGALVSTQAIWYVPVIYSRCKEETKDIMLLIGRQEEACRDVIPLRGAIDPRGSNPGSCSSYRDCRRLARGRPKGCSTISDLFLPS